MKLNKKQVCVYTCWSNVSEGPGPCWEPAEQEHVGVCESESVCVSVCWRVDLRSPRSPVMGSSQSRWPRSRCGSYSGAYPPPRLWTLDTEKQRQTDSSVQSKCHVLFFLITSLTSAKSISVFYSCGFYFFPQMFITISRGGAFLNSELRISSGTTGSMWPRLISLLMTKNCYFIPDTQHLIDFILKCHLCTKSTWPYYDVNIFDNVVPVVLALPTVE